MSLSKTLLMSDARFHSRAGSGTDGKMEPELEGTERNRGVSSEGYLRYSTEVLLFTMDADWKILNFSQKVSEQFSTAPDALRGSCLRESLLKLNSSWDSLLPDRLSEVVATERIFLPWSSIENHGLGWDVQYIAQAEVLFLSLVPMMSPEILPNLCEDQVSFDPKSLQKTIRRLFLRTQQQEMRFRYFVRHLPGAHFTQDTGLQFTFLNPALEKLFGSRHIEELRNGVHWRDWVHPSDMAEMERNLERCRKGCVPISFRFRLIMPKEDRVLYLMELRIPVRGLNGQLSGYEGIWLDLTREQLAQQRLQHAAWKESLAEISGSLSHDFNNVLGGICGMSELVYDGMDLDDRNHELVGIIRDTASQAKGLIQRIISLNREQSGQIELHDLSRMVEDQRELIRIILPKDATLEVDLPDKEILVRIDVVAFRRVLINFATNARDALGEKGIVRLRAREIDLQSYDRSCLLSSNGPTRGHAVEVIFEDNGCGVDSSMIERMFGAYFSTKEWAQGSGLGLYSLTQFARENDFDYGVRSRLGEGTEMILLIPTEVFELEETDVRSKESKCWEGRVAVYGRVAGRLHSVINTLEQKLRVEHLPNEAALDVWLQADSGPACRRILITALTYADRDIARTRCRHLEVDRSNTLSLLFLQGLNPDRFSEFVGGVFDDCVTSGSDLSHFMGRILTYLEEME